MPRALLALDHALMQYFVMHSNGTLTSIYDSLIKIHLVHCSLPKLSAVFEESILCVFSTHVYSFFMRSCCHLLGKKAPPWGWVLAVCVYITYKLRHYSVGRWLHSRSPYLVMARDGGAFSIYLHKGRVHLHERQVHPLRSLFCLCNRESCRGTLWLDRRAAVPGKLVLFISV